MTTTDFRPRAKLINPGKDVVRESLEGLVSSNPGLRLLEGENCVFRHDFRQHIAAGKVCVVSGGGSGHEPAFCGLVGAGLLTAAIAGATFTSPPPNQILAALRKLANASPTSQQQQQQRQPELDEDVQQQQQQHQQQRQQHLVCEGTRVAPTRLAANSTHSNGCHAKHAGILVIILNYTGDRLNFGLAVERFRMEYGDEKRIQLVVVGEDAALGQTGAGRRGLAGTIAILKIAGAMAEAGKSLAEMTSAVELLRERVATVGVSLGTVALPGSGRFLFDLPPGKMELGLGVHGEAGVQRVDAGSCEDIVARMGSLLLAKRSYSSSNSDTWTWSRGDKAVVLLNNLGGISHLEMGIVCKYTVLFFEKQGIDVTRLYCGSYLTSLDMAGFSVTLLKPGIETLHWLDEATTVSYWMVPYATKNCQDRLTPPCLPLVPVVDALARNRGPELSSEDAQRAAKLTRAAAKAVIARKELLNELDSGCGDGDCGSCLEEGASGILSILDSVPDVLNFPADAFARFANVAESRMGGTSGAVYSLFFGAVAAHLLASTKTQVAANKKLIAQCTRAATSKVMEYGGAQRGDRTMVDVLLALCESLEADQSCVEILAEADRAARETSGMVAAKGRASYVSVELTQGREDAGARAVAIWVEAICLGACAYNETRV